MTPTGRKDTIQLEKVIPNPEPRGSTVQEKVLARVMGSHVAAFGKADAKPATTGPLMPARFGPHSTPHDGKVAKSHSPRGAARGTPKKA